MSPLLIRLMVYGAICAALVGFGAVTMHRHDQAVLNALKSDFDAFRGGVDALGKAAQVRSQQETLANQKRKEQSDAENLRLHAADSVTIASLRRARDSARGGNVPPVPTGSGRPELACFDRPELESALGGLLAELRKLADEGTAATVDLDTAREWAKKGP